MGKVNILKINIYNSTFEELKKEISNTIEFNLKKCILYLNAYGATLLKNNINYFQALKSADIVHIDGIGIWFVIKVINKIKANRFNWTDNAYEFLSICENKQWTIFFLGSTNEILQLVKSNLNQLFPRLRLVGTLNGYSDLNISVVEIINNHNPQILWVGLSTPIQEIWIQENKNKLNCNVIQSVGDIFSLFAGKKKTRAQVFAENGV